MIVCTRCGAIREPGAEFSPGDGTWFSPTQHQCLEVGGFDPHQGPIPILNLTQHPAAPEQRAAGVENVPLEWEGDLIADLTFSSLSETTKDRLNGRAQNLADLTQRLGYKVAMIGGAPFLMEPLHRTLLYAGIQPVYAFSTRVSTETPQPDGTVIKASAFKHLGFVGLETNQ